MNVTVALYLPFFVNLVILKVTLPLLLIILKKGKLMMVGLSLWDMMRCFSVVLYMAEACFQLIQFLFGNFKDFNLFADDIALSERIKND